MEIINELMSAYYKVLPTKKTPWYFFCHCGFLLNMLFNHCCTRASVPSPFLNGKAELIEPGDEL